MGESALSRVNVAARKAPSSVGLISLWVLADDHANDNGDLIGYTTNDIDDEAEIPGFCDALPEEWIDVSGEWVRLPNYLEHNGETAKKTDRRSTPENKTTGGVTRFCDKCHKNVTRCCDKCHRGV